MIGAMKLSVCSMTTEQTDGRSKFLVLTVVITTTGRTELKVR